MRLPLLALIVFTFATSALAQSLKEIRYLSSADNSKQPAMFYAPGGQDAVPLVVALHTWSADYRQSGYDAIAQWCMKNGWAYIRPNFRGPNKRPEATGSELVVKDIVSAVEHAKKNARVDASSVYLTGVSGGGYTALLMAGRRPDVWAGVSAWASISDLKAWYHESKQANRKYYKDLIASCGGAPGDSPAVDEEYRKRSPLTHLANAKGVKMQICTGINDGHTGSVPISHTLRAFNEVADAKDRISKNDICFFVEEAKVPEHLKQNISDPTYGEKQPLFRRSSGNAEVTIFDGGHEYVLQAAIAWIDAVHRNKGQ